MKLKLSNRNTTILFYYYMYLSMANCCLNFKIKVLKSEAKKFGKVGEEFENFPDLNGTSTALHTIQSVFSSASLQFEHTKDVHCTCQLHYVHLVQMIFRQKFK